MKFLQKNLKWILVLDDFGSDDSIRYFNGIKLSRIF